MNDLGWTLGWLTVQVTLLLVPAIGLHALASRRGPATGAWAATMTLAMVVVLPWLAFLPATGREGDRPARAASLSLIDRDGGPSEVAAPEREARGDQDASAADRRPVFDGFRLAWRQFGRRAVGPVAIFRGWGKALALVSLAGSGIALIQLLLGLGAVAACRRSARVVEDPAMVALVEELRGSMGCRRSIELREVPELTTPATAGWLWPMLLLPGDWRGWGETERRAVVAHELAHVVRGDYASGLLARVAVALNWYHPMVRWLTGRLHLEQELAADAMGAQFAGGRPSYLRALSRLALEQDGRPASWPARAFLPSRGTLIRRIAMLKDEAGSKQVGRGWSKPRRLTTAFGLLALTVAVGGWKAPAVVADDKPAPASSDRSKDQAADFAEVSRPFDVRYLPEGTSGAMVIRPAAIARRVGMGDFASLIQAGLGGDLTLLAKRLGVDMSRPGFVKLGPADIDAITFGLTLGQIDPPPGADKDGPRKLHTIGASGVTVRTFAPFDWPALFRQWTMELEPVKVAGGVYYKTKDPAKAELLMQCVVYQPDDRTVVFEGEDRIKRLIAGETRPTPAYLAGDDWKRACRGLIAIALDNQGDRLCKTYDLGRPDDKVALQALQGVARWIIGVADADMIDLRAEATTLDPRAAESLARSIEALAKLALTAMNADEDLPEEGLQGDYFKMCKDILAKIKPVPAGPSVTVEIDRMATFPDFIAILKADIQAEMTREAKADPKAEKR